MHTTITPLHLAKSFEQCLLHPSTPPHHGGDAAKKSASHLSLRSPNRSGGSSRGARSRSSGLRGRSTGERRSVVQPRSTVRVLGCRFRRSRPTRSPPSALPPSSPSTPPVPRAPPRCRAAAATGTRSRRRRRGRGIGGFVVAAAGLPAGALPSSLELASVHDGHLRLGLALLLVAGCIRRVFVPSGGGGGGDGVCGGGGSAPRRRPCHGDHAPVPVRPLSRPNFRPVRRRR